MERIGLICGIRSHARESSSELHINRVDLKRVVIIGGDLGAGGTVPPKSFEVGDGPPKLEGGRPTVTYFQYFAEISILYIIRNAHILFIQANVPLNDEMTKKGHQEFWLDNIIIGYGFFIPPKPRANSPPMVGLGSEP